MVDGFDGLRHYAVVGSHDDDYDIGYFGTASTHGGECLVAWGVEECDTAAVGELDVVSADVLGDATCFAGDYV